MMKIVIVGEAWGADEEKHRMPFVGASGFLLTKMLAEAGIDRSSCFLTNVFNLRPKNNDLSTLCASKAEAITGRPPLQSGKYVSARYADELSRLDKELKDKRPNVIIAAGNTPNWFLGGSGGISRIRGTTYSSKYGKVLPTYHPAAVLRDWTLRPVTILDLTKARREAEFPDVRRPAREIVIEPDLSDMENYYATRLERATQIAFDIETSGTQITCIGFAPSPYEAIVVPFTDLRRSSGSYWETELEEINAWAWVRKVLATPTPKVAQNGLYDVHFLWKSYGIPVCNFVDDTMLLHHSLQPESEKGLGFLGSIYTNEASWKMMRTRAKETIKRDE